MLRAAVERKFGILGEALAQLAKYNPTLATRVSEHRHIIAFRNILVHGYVDGDDRLAWDVIESKLARLQEEIAALLQEKQSQPPRNNAQKSPSRKNPHGKTKARKAVCLPGFVL